MHNPTDAELDQLQELARYNDDALEAFNAYCTMLAVRDEAIDDSAPDAVIRTYETELYIARQELDFQIRGKI